MKAGKDAMARSVGGCWRGMLRGKEFERAAYGRAWYVSFKSTRDVRTYVSDVCMYVCMYVECAPTFPFFLFFSFDVM